MTNRITLLTFIVAVFAMAYSCSKSTTKTAFTNASIKPLMETKCASCHASGKVNAGEWLYDPTDYDATITSHKEHLKELVLDKKTMPPTGLTVAEYTAFQSWVSAGYPAN